MIDTKDENEIINNYKSYFNLFVDLLNVEEKTIGCRVFFETYKQFKNKQLVDLMNGKLKQSNSYTQLSDYNGEKPLIFVFDESSSLLKSNNDRESNYFILRRLLCEIQGKVFVLFTDTFTNLSEYIPIKSQNHKKVFEPIYLLPTWDLFADYESIKTIKDTTKFENVGQFGRVLWGSLIDTKRNSKGKFKKIKDSELFELVVTKLVGGKNFEKDKIDKNDHIAILSTRLGAVKPSESVSTSHNLVAKNMAVCTYFNINENDLKSTTRQSQYCH